MESCDYAYRIFRRHLDRAPLCKTSGLVMLELGPGDSLFSALFAKAHGAAHSILIDVGPYALRNVAPYLAAAEALERQGRTVPRIDGCHDLDAILDACQAKYLTMGLKSLRSVESQSVDFIWSQAVLEHVRRNEFVDTLRELCRILRPNGVASHRVDLRDHLGGRLNNLRFSRETWEGKFFVNSGFYTNRIRFQEMLDLFDQAGLSYQVVGKEGWESMPTPLAKLAPEFRKLSQDDLLVRGFDVLLTPKNQTVAA